MAARHVVALRRMTELLGDPRNWAKNDRKQRSVDGTRWQYCLVGARDEVLAHYNNYYARESVEQRVEHLLAETVAEQYPEIVGKAEASCFEDAEDIIFVFNDDDRTEHADIMRVLEKTYIRAAEEV